jgi:ribose transport system substrate-binding protein
MKTTRIVPSLLAIASIALCTAAFAADQPESVPLKPITKKLTFIYIPKLVHPWYEEVKRGVEYGIQEVKKEGIDVDYIWDAPAQADVDEENKKIEAAISRKPDGLCVSCLDPATNAQMLDEAIKAGLNVLTFNATGGPKYPFVGRNKDAEDGYICGKYVMEKMGKKGNVEFFWAA